MQTQNDQMLDNMQQVKDVMHDLMERNIMKEQSDQQIKDVMDDLIERNIVIEQLIRGLANKSASQLET